MKYVTHICLLTLCFSGAPGITVYTYAGPKDTTDTTTFRTVSLSYSTVSTYYTVQLSSWSDSTLAYRMRDNFSILFPEDTALVRHEQGLYKLQAGRYLTRDHAEARRDTFRTEYPEAFIVTHHDTIHARKQAVFVRADMAPAAPYYTVQLTLGEDSSKVAAAQREYAMMFDENAMPEAFIVHRSPYYKLRSGRFSTRAAAEAASDKLTLYYPDAFIVHETKPAAKSRIGEAPPSGVHVRQPALLDTLLQQLGEWHLNNPTVRGFRVQVFSGSDRHAASEAKAQAIRHFSDQEVTMVYEQPYFKVRVGGFHSIWEAQRCRKHVQKHFEHAFIVKEDLKIAELDELEKD